jgi:sulfatase maturation enzyme AslB (radical SAM superfamily)
MYKLKDIRTIHIETSEKCQAGCPICPRHMKDGSLNPELINAELSVADIRKYFSRSFVKQLHKMYMCGNYGEPIIAKDALEIFEYFRYNNPFMGLDLHTNGGARTTEWWRDLAHVMYNDSSKVIFSFDGLADTNDIYRKNVNWDIAMNSARSFIGAGGNAVWSFLVFKHNEHQVEEARALSEKMGFKQFVAKKSARFRKDHHHPYLEMPTNPLYQNQTLPFANDANYDTAEIDCLVKEHGNMYVSARGLLFPCCWLAAIYGGDAPEIRKLYGNFEFNNLNKHSLEEIFETGIFDRVEQSWSCGSLAEGKLKVCARSCPKHNNFFKAQFE